MARRPTADRLEYPPTDVLLAAAACIPLPMAYTHAPAMRAIFELSRQRFKETPMTTAPSPYTAPRSLMLATDLSASCDRALDRAVQLTHEWQAELIALHVLDPSTSPDQILAWVNGASDEALSHVARQQLARDLGAIDVPVKLRITRSGNTSAAIRASAHETGAGLVVTGVSGNKTLARLLLGSTVENLARSLSVPLLVVRNRVHEAYRRIVVATDFSASSFQALMAAAQLFPKRELTLYHAHAPLMEGSADTSSHPGACAGIEETECVALLAHTTPPAGVNLRLVVDRGAIETALTRYVREHDIDLVVMGSHGSSGIMSLLLGSTAARLLDWLPCDMLLVRKPHATACG